MAAGRGGGSAAREPSRPSHISRLRIKCPLQEDGNAGDVLPASGVKLGADLALRMRGTARGGRDALLAECRLNPAADQISLKKVRGWAGCWRCFALLSTR